MTAAERRLEGRCAFVTGGAGGLGRATAEIMVREGASVFRCRVGKPEYTPPELQGARLTVVTHCGMWLLVARPWKGSQMGG